MLLPSAPPGFGAPGFGAAAPGLAAADWPGLAPLWAGLACASPGFGVGVGATAERAAGFGAAASAGLFAAGFGADC
jgi:hypothetical protein